jgi:hypothetical protein
MALALQHPVDKLERALLDAEAAGHGVELETWHHFADGLVARTIFIPAGTVLTGAMHKAEALNIAAGDISVTTAHGVRRITGYAVLPSLADSKRAGIAHADTYWTTVHVNPGNERDIAKLEDALVHGAEGLQRRRLPAIAEEQRVRIDEGKTA